MIDLKLYGYKETITPTKGVLPGRVIELQRGKYNIITENGEVPAILKGSFLHGTQNREDFPCVGDFVLLQHNAYGVSRIVSILPRRSKFSRADFSGHGVGYVKTVLEQLVAANFDYVFILSSLNLDFNPGRILRYLTQTRKSGAVPVVLLTKADLAQDYAKPAEQIRDIAPDVAVHAISSHTGFGLDALHKYLCPGNTVVFLGMSGVGKSSLLNTLMERKVMEVKKIREDDSRGRHTTTHRQLFMLQSGAMVIDTPGMRELGLFDADEGISAGFADIERLLPMCRFSDCRHTTEPGCAVAAAIEEGVLARDRWESYREQIRETRFVEMKSANSGSKKVKAKNVVVKGRNRKKYDSDGEWE